MQCFYHPRGIATRGHGMEGSMRKTSWRFDRRWGAVCPPTFVFIMMVLAALTTAAFASPTTDDPLNSANLAQEVTATAICDDTTAATPVATTSVVVPLAEAPTGAIDAALASTPELTAPDNPTANFSTSMRGRAASSTTTRTAEETFRGAAMVNTVGNNADPP